MRHLCKDNTGAAYILALVTLTSGLILGVAALQMSTGGWIAETNSTARLTAQGLADAGVDYAWWKTRYTMFDFQQFSETRSLQLGSINVTVSDNGNNIPSTLKVDSKAQYKSYSARSTKIIPGKMPYDYQMATTSGGNFSERIRTGSSDANLRFNGPVQFANPLTSITGQVTSTGQITVSNGSVSGTKLQNAPPIWFPSIDYAAYQSRAAAVYNSDKSYTLLIFPYENAIIYVNGKVTISGIIVGKGTIVATEGFQVSGSLLVSGLSTVSLVTTKEIRIASSAASVQAILYAHAPDNSASVRTEGTINLFGSISADSVNMQSGSSLTVYRNGNYDRDLFRNMKLPGFL